jgi:dTDP-4-dehydrorhamnose 3,5-epimerase-like enzyme
MSQPYYPTDGYAKTMLLARTYNLDEIGSANTGFLGILEGSDIPFEPKRVYWLRNVPAGVTRGNHAHKLLEQLFIPISGSVQVTLHDGVQETKINLTAGDQYLYLKPGLWREISNFSLGASLLVLASKLYDESDYIRDWNEFLIWKSNQ